MPTWRARVTGYRLRGIWQGLRVLAGSQGPGHGTGFQDQIIIEARDFLRAIETNTPVWPTFQDGMDVNQIIAAAMASSRNRAWVDVADF